MAESTARIGIYADDKASPVVKSVQGWFQSLEATAKKSILTGIGIGSGVAAFQTLSRGVHDVIGYFGSSIQAASDLNETIQKSQVVFGRGAADIESWGKSASRSFGLSENSAIAAAATFGNLFVSLGQAPDKVAPMSMALVKLAADLASFNNIPIEDALAKLQSGIVGQERPLRELGVAISAASVDTEALALGFTKVNGVFTEGEKVQARYSLIFKQTHTAQGDFARTSEALANSQRTLKAELEDVSAQVGNALLPAMVELAHIAKNTLVPAISSAVPVFAAALPIIMDLGKTAVPLLAVVLGTKLVGALRSATTAGLSFGGMLGIVAAAVLAGRDDMQSAEAAILRQGIAQKLGTKAAEEFSRALAENGGDLGKATKAAEDFSNRTIAMFGGWGPRVHAALASGASEVADAAYNTLDIPIWQAAYDAKAKAQEQAGKIPAAMGDEMLKNEKDLTDSAATLMDFLATALTPGQERAAAISFLTSDAYAQALASGKPAAVTKAGELANAALVVLWGATASGTAAGTGVGNAWVDGLNKALAAGYSGQTYTWIQKYEKLLKFAGSPDYTKAIKAGTGVAKGWLSGFNNGMGAGKVNLPSLSGASGGMTMAGAGGGGGMIELHVHSHLDGREIAENVTRHQYYMAPTVGPLGKG